MKHRKHSSYEKPHKKGCKHRFEADARGKIRCVKCGVPPTPKGKDPKVKARMKARTKQKRMPPPKRGH